MSYNKAIHHRRSLRLKNFDYASAGAYFITICTHQRACVFGKIANDVMQTSDAGKIVASVWDEIPANYPNVETDEFIVMPNHIHGIIVINAFNITTLHVGARFIAPQTIGEIVRAFKARSSRAVNKTQSRLGISVWQRNYYEHVIRGENELSAIREYIVNNPLQWDLDSNNPHKGGAENANIWTS